MTKDLADHPCQLLNDCSRISWQFLDLGITLNDNRFCSQLPEMIDKTKRPTNKPGNSTKAFCCKSICAPEPKRMVLAGMQDCVGKDSQCGARTLVMLRNNDRTLAESIKVAQARSERSTLVCRDWVSSCAAITSF